MQTYGTRQDEFSYLAATSKAEIIEANHSEAAMMNAARAIAHPAHAYGHWVGRTVGILIDGVGIVAATVMTPEPDQDHNLLTVMTEDNVWHTVPAMETRRADFVNATLAD